MTGSRTFAYMRMEGRILLREPAALFFTLAFPLLLLFIFGSIWGNEPVAQYGNRGYITLSLPGFIAMIVATSGLLTLSATTASYREIGFFRLLQTTPLSPLTVLFGQIATLFLVTLAGVMLLLIAAVAIWDAQFPSVWRLLFPLCLGCLAFYSFGFMVAMSAPSVRSAQVISMVLFFPMLFLSGAAFPSALLPPGVRSVALFLPLTHLVDLFNRFWFGSNTADTIAAAKNMIALMVFSGLNLVFVCAMFSWDDRDSAKRASRFVAPAVWLGLWLFSVVFMYGVALGLF